MMVHVRIVNFSHTLHFWESSVFKNSYGIYTITLSSQCKGNSSAGGFNPSSPASRNTCGLFLNPALALRGFNGNRVQSQPDKRAALLASCS